jgi:hypothetical protein
MLEVVGGGRTLDRQSEIKDSHSHRSIESESLISKREGVVNNEQPILLEPIRIVCVYRLGRNKMCKAAAAAPLQQK